MSGVRYDHRSVRDIAKHAAGSEKAGSLALFSSNLRIAFHLFVLFLDLLPAHHEIFFVLIALV